MKRLLALFLLLAVIFNTAACSSQQLQSSALGGEQYKTAVYRAFLDSIYDSLGVEDSDYKHIECSYMTDYLTTDRHISHYYFIRASYGDRHTHELTARAYYVPDIGRTVFFPYISLDGEVIHSAEEEETWLKGICD